MSPSVQLAHRHSCLGFALQIATYYSISSPPVEKDIETSAVTDVKTPAQGKAICNI